MGRSGRRLKHAVEYVGFRGLTAAVRAASPSAAARWADGLGRFAFDTARVRRDVALQNVRERLAPAGGEPECEAIARRSYQVAARTFLDLLRGDRISDDELWRLVRRDEIERLLPVLREGKGGVLVSGHFGNWELLVLAVHRLGVPVGAMAGDQANPRVNTGVQEFRRRAGIVPISARHGLRAAIRCLRDDGFVATLMDQDARRKGIFVDFLGTKASAHTGVVSLAMRSGSPLVPGVLVDEGGSFRFVQGEIWRPDPGLDEAENLRSGAESFHEVLEEQVRAHPGNYFWAHRRWKTRPLVPEAPQ